MTESESKTTAIKRTRTLILERWPQLFNEKKPVPLAVGIKDALAEAMPEVELQYIWRVLVNWCNRPHYLSSLKAGAKRVGLDGEAHGDVTEAEAEHAAGRLQAAQALFRQREEAKREIVRQQEAKAKRKAEQEEAARLAKAEEARKAKSAAQAPRSAPKPSKPPAPAPVIMVKKRRFTPPGEA